MNDLEDIIKSTVQFNSVASTGFHTLHCPMCGDTKRIRAGFIFTNDSIGYSCFRGKCDANTVYKYDEPMSYKFKKLMDALDVPVPIELLMTKRGNCIKEILNDTKYEKCVYKTIDIPENFIKINEIKHKKYLKWLQDRHIMSYDGMYIGTKGDWKHKLIIIFKHNCRIIGWQGVDISTGKYLKCSVQSDLMFINNEHGRIIDNPVIVEGVFDSLSIPNSIAVLGNHVSKKQAYFFRNKNPILLPDRKDSDFLKTMNLYRWKMSIPDWDNKDVNDALQQYGLFIVAKMIHDGVEENSIKIGVKYRLWKN